MLNNILEAIVIYSSLIFGKILNMIAKEEIRQGKKYIIAARNILIIIISMVFVYLNFKLNFILFLFLGFGIFIFLKKSLLIYFLIGLATFLSLLNSNQVLLLSLIFLLAIIQSSLSFPNRKEFFVASICFILPFSLILIETFIKGNPDIFTGFVAGGLLAQLMGP